MSLIPIALFVYNRPYHTEKTIKALLNNFSSDNTPLYIFSDAPKNFDSENSVKKVRDFVGSINGFKQINLIQREKNLGLSESIINGISTVLNNYDSVIVLEDDLITSRNFISYMNSALNFYKNIENVFSVAGYSPPLSIQDKYDYDSYLIPTRSASWGWGTWKHTWENIDWGIKDYNSFINNDEKTFDFNFMGNDMSRMLKAQIEGEINSWSIRFDYHLYKNNAFCAYPVKSKIQNTGMDDSGTHSDATDEYHIELDNSNKLNFNFAINPEEIFIKISQKFYNDRLAFFNKLKRKINSFRKN